MKYKYATLGDIFPRNAEKIIHQKYINSFRNY